MKRADRLTKTLQPQSFDEFGFEGITEFDLFECLPNRFTQTWLRQTLCGRVHRRQRRWQGRNR